MRMQFFDFEVYPDWWCNVIGIYPEDDTHFDESLKDNFLVFTSDDYDVQRKMFDTMLGTDRVNVGYNIKGYDNIILNAIANGCTPHQVRVVSDLIINPELAYRDDEHKRFAGLARKRFTNPAYIYQDELDDNVNSLKDKESCMGLDIRETTVPFDKENLTEEEKAEIIFYCKHDVWSSMAFYRQILKPFISTKLLVGKVFNIPAAVCYKSTNATLSGRALSAVKTTFPDAERQDITIPTGLKSYITYALPKDIVDRVCQSTEKFNIILAGSLVTFANGGIHSVPAVDSVRDKSGLIITKKPEDYCVKNLIVETNDEFALINVDGASFYPSIMIHWKTLSRAVQHPEKFEEMYHARLNFKKVIEPFENKYGKRVDLAPKEEYDHYIQCKETSQAYKLILNTTYGASGNKYLDLSDPYMTTVTCRLGQLILMALANNLYTQLGKDNFLLVQSNTDGLLCYIRRTKLDLFYQICDMFTQVTQILLEAEEEGKIWQRDVNNYIMVKKSGREKTKGGFFVTDMQQPGYNRVRPLDGYVCREAMMQYLLHGKSIVETIYNEKDLSKFIISCNKGSFGGIVREFNDSRPDEVLHKCNRAYASLNTTYGVITRLKKYNGEYRKYKCPGCPPHCGLLNDALYKYDADIVRKDIDFEWYLNETYNMLNEPWFEAEGAKIVSKDIFKDMKI